MDGKLERLEAERIRSCVDDLLNGKLIKRFYGVSALLHQRAAP
jgi:hypothetical protein